MVSQRTLLAVALAMIFCLVEQGNAQTIFTKPPTGSTYSGWVKSTDVPNFTVNRLISNTLNRGGLFGRPASTVMSGLTTTSSPATKPFTYVTQHPTVSPYLNLLRRDEGEAAPNYYSIVKPQLDQININQQQMRQNQQMARRIQGIQSRPAFPVSGSEYLIPTGHQAIFMNYLHYYPMPRRTR